MNKRSLSDLPPADLRGRRALVRVDYNVPLDASGAVADANRVEATVPTLRRLLDAGASPVLLSHLGRPKGVPDPRYTLAPVAPVLSRLLGAPVRFVGPADSEEAREASRSLEPGEVLLLENTRFLPGETTNDPALAATLAELGDLFVSDAFGSTHRAHASVVGVASALHPAVAGDLVETELRALAGLVDVPERPFIVAFGGAKIGDKIALMKTFLDRADSVLVGGAMANTFLKAGGSRTGSSLVEDEAVDVAARFLEDSADRIRLPTDVVVGAVDPESKVEPRAVSASDIPDGLAALDIGPETAEAYAWQISKSRTFFWNGPMGLFERDGFGAGTLAVAQAAADATRSGAFTVIGGGDSAAAIRKAGLADAVSHVSTGGGAALEYLAHGTLPGLEALDDS